jgi:hypothetical protein
MAQLDRAAQFAPFAALNGYEEAIEETGRLTTPEAELMEGMIERVDEGLRTISRKIEERPQIEVTYFCPDQRKSGGAYRKVTGRVRKLLEQERALLLTDDTLISFDKIRTLQVR